MIGPLILIAIANMTVGSNPGQSVLKSIIILAKNLYETECVISGTTGGLMDPNYCYKIS